MGSPKALLKIGGGTFLQHIVGTLRSAGFDSPDSPRFSNLTVVLGSDAPLIAAHLDSLQSTRVKIVVNNLWQEGQLSSILAGLDAVDRETSDGILIWPVDHPLVLESTISRMLVTFSKHPRAIVLPTFRGKRGHPVLVSKDFFTELESAPKDTGMRAVIWDHPGDVVEVETQDEGIMLNIDTKELYDRHIGAKP